LKTAGTELTLDGVTKLCDTLFIMKTATIRVLRYDFAKLEVCVFAKSRFLSV